MLWRFIQKWTNLNIRHVSGGPFSAKRMSKMYVWWKKGNSILASEVIIISDVASCHKVICCRKSKFYWVWLYKKWNSYGHTRDSRILAAEEEGWKGGINMEISIYSGNDNAARKSPFRSFYTLRGCTGSALAFPEGRTFASQSVSLVICSLHWTVQYVELRGYCPV